MELRRYWAILRKRIWIPLLLILVVLGSALLFRRPRPPLYQATMRFTVGVRPEPKGQEYAYDRYYTWLASEYLIDDLSEVVKSAAFARAVSEELADKGITVPAGVIQGSTMTGKLHRILTVSITWGDAEELADIASAAAHVLAERNADFLVPLGGERAAVCLIDPPVVAPARRSLRERLDLPLRLFLALLAGGALAFLLDYLDDTVRDREELEAMGFEVLAEIPPPPRRWFLPRGR